MHALINLQDKAISAIKNNSFGIGIFLDLSKAFDIVNHEILLYKLSYYGVRGVQLQWFQSYLKCRYQYTVFNNYSSDRILVQHGVPQGSILGPLLFLIYVTDIKSSDKFEFTMYADDTTLFYSQPDPTNLEFNVNSELTKVSKWFKASKLIINKKKSNSMVFCNNNMKNLTNELDGLIFSIDSTPLLKVNVVNFLGIHIERNLKWDVHINHIVGKTSRCIGMLYKVRHHLPVSCMVD